MHAEIEHTFGHIGGLNAAFLLVVARQNKLVHTVLRIWQLELIFELLFEVICIDYRCFRYLAKTIGAEHEYVCACPHYDTEIATKGMQFADGVRPIIIEIVPVLAVLYVHANHGLWQERFESPNHTNRP